jgi:hypothetical protein
MYKVPTRGDSRLASSSSSIRQRRCARVAHERDLLAGLEPG